MARQLAQQARVVNELVACHVPANVMLVKLMGNHRHISTHCATMQPALYGNLTGRLLLEW